MTIHKESESWETKVRNDYKGIISETQIEATIEYWRKILDTQKEELLTELGEEWDKMHNYPCDCVHVQKECTHKWNDEFFLFRSLLQAKRGKK